MAPTGHFPYKYLRSCHLFFHTTQYTGTTTPPAGSEAGKGREGSILIVRAEHSCLQQPQTITRRDSRGSDSAYVMSRGSKGGRGGALDLKLHLSPPAPARGSGTGRASSSSDEEWSSSPSSCLSSEEGEREPQLHSHGLQWSDSPEATSMVLAACPRCLMYVMLSEADPRCPRCRSPVLLDFLHHAAAAAARNSSSINVNVSREDGDHSRNSTRGGGGRNRTA